MIGGQSTCARELLEQVDGLDAIIAPIRGGGTVSGTCLVIRRPGVDVYAAEPKNADDAFRRFRAGRIIADDAPEAVADGLKVPLKHLTWHFVSRHVTDNFTATEEQIIKAMKLTWKRMKIVMEPSYAVPLAAILAHPAVFRGRRVGVIITGGNVDLDKLPWMKDQADEQPCGFSGIGGQLRHPRPAGMDEAGIQTPCLILHMDAQERNIIKMGAYARAQGMRHRAHGRMHKSVDVAKLQLRLGGAVGVCSQKVSEAEVFARGGIKDILVVNQVRDPDKIDRLERLPKPGVRTLFCVDDLSNVADLSAVPARHGTWLDVLVEIDCGAGRCGELQCGSYAFMDADYGRILDKEGRRIDQSEWENALSS